MKKVSFFLQWFGLGIFLGLVILNFFSSQESYPPPYESFITGDKNTLNWYLEKIKGEEYFSKELERIEKIFGRDKVKAFLSQRVREDLEINKLKQPLSFNPNSRDLLYNLYIMYKQRGEKGKASFYLDKACKVDPLLKGCK